MRTPVIDLSHAGTCKVTSVGTPAMAKNGTQFVSLGIDAPSVLDSGAIRYQNYRVLVFEDHPQYKQVTLLKKGEPIRLTASIRLTATGPFYGLDRLETGTVRSVNVSALKKFSE